MVNVHATGPFGLVILTFLISGYFVPTIVSAARGRNMLGVFVLNLVLGWTFIGWLVALYIAAREAPTGVAGATG
jgi:Superinfection immunity protein